MSPKIVIKVLMLNDHCLLCSHTESTEGREQSTTGSSKLNPVNADLILTNAGLPN